MGKRESTYDVQKALIGRAYQYDSPREFPPGKMSNEFDAIELWHVDIGNDDVGHGLDVSDEPDGYLSIFGDIDFRRVQFL